MCSGWSRSALIHSRSRAAPRAPTTSHVPARPTARRSTTRWPAAASTRRRSWRQSAGFPALLGQLEGLANRGYTDGFYQRHTPAETQNYLRGHSESDRSQYVGDVVAWDAARGLAEITVKNKFGVGDRLELILPAGNREVVVTRMENAAGEPVNVAPGSGHRVWLPLPPEAVGAFVARYV